LKRCVITGGDLNYCLECHNVTFSWPNGNGIRKLDISIAEGSVTALIGRNGAGKTTLIDLIMGFIKPDNGEIRIFGRDAVTGRDVSYKRNIGYCPAEKGLLENLTVIENFELISWLRTGNKKKWKEEAEWVELFDCNKLLSERVENMSSGQRRRANIVSALIGKPKILILDEPGNDLDIEGLFILKHLLSAVSKDHAVIVSTHIIDVIRGINGKVLFLEDGEKVYEGDILSDRSLEDLYRDIIWKPEDKDTLQ